MKKEKNVITVPNKIIQNTELDVNEKVVYALGIKFFLFSGEYHSKTIAAFKKYLTKTLEFNRNTYPKIVDSLVSKGYIENNKILLPLESEVYTYNAQDANIFGVESEMRFIGGFTKVPLVVLTSKDLTSKDKVLYMALKRSWEFTEWFRKNKGPRSFHFNIIENETYKYNLKGETKKNRKHLKDLGFIDYEVEKTGSKVNHQEVLDLRFYGFEEAKDEIEVVETSSYVSLFDELMAM